ncbi:MAG: hypothetical protein ACTHNW_10875 [Mucilaginibacter sp.]
MKYLYLAILTFVFPVSLYAQSNYKPGYVVTLKGDTLKGYINYKEWEYNPWRIEFKTSLNDVKTAYSTENTTGFAISGFETYRRFTLSVSRDQTEYLNLSQGIDTTTVSKTAFFKIIATGKNVTLYSYADKTKQRFFIAEGTQMPVELIYHIYIDPNGLNQVLTDAGYKKQLLKLAAQYQPAQTQLLTEIQEADYKYDEMVKVTNRINGLYGLTAEQKKLTKPGIVFFITAGANSSTVKLSGIDNLNTPVSSSSLFPQIGAGINLYLNKNVGRLIFRSEVNFTGSKSNFDFTYNPSPDQSIVSYTEMMSFKMYRFSLAPQILYNIYNSQQFKFFLAAGVNMEQCFYSDKQYTIITHSSGAGSGADQSEPGLFPFTYNLNFNMIGKAGVAINNQWELYAAYVPSTELIKDSYHMTLTQYTFGLSYLFSKQK